MPIVRSDKRPEAIKLLAEVRTQLRGLLTQADALQATTEALEVSLGLTNEGEQATRDQLMVLHFPAGDDKGHTLDECSDACIAEDALVELGEGGTEAEGEQTEGEPEAG